MIELLQGIEGKAGGLQVRMWVGEELRGCLQQLVHGEPPTTRLVHFGARRADPAFESGIHIGADYTRRTRPRQGNEEKGVAILEPNTKEMQDYVKSLAMLVRGLAHRAGWAGTIEKSKLMLDKEHMFML